MQTSSLGCCGRRFRGTCLVEQLPPASLPSRTRAIARWRKIFPPRLRLRGKSKQRLWRALLLEFGPCYLQGKIPPRFLGVLRQGLVPPETRWRTSKFPQQGLLLGRGRPPHRGVSLDAIARAHARRALVGGDLPATLRGAAPGRKSRRLEAAREGKPCLHSYPLLFRLDTNLNFCRHFWRTSPIPGGRRQSTPMDGMLCSRLEARRRSSRPSSMDFRLSFANSGLNLKCPSE